MHPVISSSEERMKKSIAALKEDLATVRSGRASAALLDKVYVEYYGEKTVLSNVANISVPEARLIVISPWEKNLIGDIEKAILASDLGLNPSNDGKVIRLAIPPLSEERRKELVKVCKGKAEQTRVSIRNIRRDGNEELKKEEKDSNISEDEEKKASDALQKLTDRFVQEVSEILEEKEKEILEI